MSDKAVINFTRGVPATESFPIEEMTTAAKAAVEKYGPTILQYGSAYGFLPLREWLAEWYGVKVDQVLTANGSLQLIEFLSYHFIQPGDTVFTESPSYDRTITLLRRHQANVVGIPLAPDGPNIEALEAALKQYVPKLFYMIPPSENAEWFQATIGGMGLTGLILWAEIELKRIHNAAMEVETIRCAGLDDFFELCAESDPQYEYTVAWIDCMVQGKHLGRGHFIRREPRRTECRLGLSPSTPDRHPIRSAVSPDHTLDRPFV